MAGASRPSVGGHASVNTDGAKALGRGAGLSIRPAHQLDEVLLDVAFDVAELKDEQAMLTESPCHVLRGGRHGGDSGAPEARGGVAYG